MAHLRIESAVIGDRPASVQARAGAVARAEAEAADELRRLGCMLCGRMPDARRTVLVEKHAGALVAVCWPCQCAHGGLDKAFNLARATVAPSASAARTVRGSVGSGREPATASTPTVEVRGAFACARCGQPATAGQIVRGQPCCLTCEPLATPGQH